MDRQTAENSFTPGRRQFLAGIAACSTLLAARPAAALTAAAAPEDGPPLALLSRATAALARHREHVRLTDVMGIVDFNRHSSRPRFYLYEPATGRARSLLVSHGRGSDPAHSGYLQRFSSVPGSAASSAGAYVTGDAYVGQHGPSRRLHGLDPDNATAFDRAIVIHGAWYVSNAMVAQHGRIGRSEGCFAFDEAVIGTVLDRLGPGRMIYADKL